MWQKIKFFLFENTSTGQTVIKNTAWLFAGQMGSRLLRAAIVIYSARALGAGSYGAFSYALGVAAFLTIFSDIGINALITKETARDPERKSRYLSTAFIIKLVLLALAGLGSFIALPYIGAIPGSRVLLPILFLVFAFDTLRDLGSALSRALEQMEIEAGVNIFTNFAITALGFAVLLRGGGSISLAWAYAIGSGLGFIAIFYILRSHFTHLFRHFTPEFIKPIFATAWPFGLLGIMGAIMTNTDIIILGWLRTAPEVGFYSAVQKLILLAYVLPALLASGSFPTLTRLVKSDRAQAKNLLWKTIKISLLAAGIILIGGLIFGRLTFNLLYGAEYLPGLTSFYILLLGLLVVFPGTLTGNALFAYDEQKYFLKFVIVSTLANAALDLLLIPTYGIEGSAIATVLTQLITNALMFYKIRQVINKS